MEIEYTYINIQGFPKATEISRSRESLKAHLCTFIIPFTIYGFLLSETIIAKIAVVLVAVLILLYLATVYNQITKKKVKKAIQEQLRLNEMVRNTKYACVQTEKLNDIGVGQCMLCYTKAVPISRYRVKWPTETRELPVCESCVKKLLENCNH